MAEAAVGGEHGRKYGDNELRVEISKDRPAGERRERREGRRGPPKRTDYRVRVTHLPYHCSWQVGSVVHAPHVLGLEGSYEPGRRGWLL